MKETIKRLASEYFDEVVKIRRHLHKYPELSYKENKTSEYIQQILNNLDIQYKKGFVQTGILGKITGNNPSKRVVALRADMDALPVEEKNHLDYCSVNKGIMHACGHDAHTAMLLGAAKILKQLRSRFEGTVLLIFQPAEEKVPGGAKQMLEEGIFDEVKPELVLGQHVMPGLQTGKIGLRPGKYMASVDEIYLSIKGDGGHAAMPHQLTDTVLIAANILVALQQVISRKSPPQIPSVLSFGKIDAPGAANIIPPLVNIDGTFRTMDEQWRKQAHEHIKTIAGLTANSMNGQCDVRIKNGYPAVINHEEKTKQIINSASKCLGQENVVDLDIEMTAEDFSYFSRNYPAVFYRLGISDEHPENNFPLHSPTFNLDEKALKTGMETLAWLTFDYLDQ